jgi:hypothetical protein
VRSCVGHKAGPAAANLRLEEPDQAYFCADKNRASIPKKRWEL